jgi:hypothetical protein
MVAGALRVLEMSKLPLPQAAIRFDPRRESALRDIPRGSLFLFLTARRISSWTCNSGTE